MTSMRRSTPAGRSLLPHGLHRRSRGAEPHGLRPASSPMLRYRWQSAPEPSTPPGQPTLPERSTTAWAVDPPSCTPAPRFVARSAASRSARTVATVRWPRGSPTSARSVVCWTPCTRKVRRPGRRLDPRTRPLRSSRAGPHRTRPWDRRAREAADSGDPVSPPPTPVSPGPRDTWCTSARGRCSGGTGQTPYTEGIPPSGPMRCRRAPLGRSGPRRTSCHGRRRRASVGSSGQTARPHR